VLLLLVAGPPVLADLLELAMERILVAAAVGAELAVELLPFMLDILLRASQPLLVVFELSVGSAAVELLRPLVTWAVAEVELVAVAVGFI
jgi:hypothetical protein